MLTLLVIDLENNETASDKDIEKIAADAFEVLEKENNISHLDYQPISVTITHNKDITVNKGKTVKELPLPINKGGKSQRPVKRNKGIHSTSSTKQVNEKPNSEFLALAIYDNICGFLASIEGCLHVFNCDTGIYDCISLEGGKFTSFMYRYCPVTFKQYLTQSIASKIYHIILVACQHNGAVFTMEQITYNKNRLLLLGNCFYGVSDGIISGFTPSIPFTRRGLNIRLKDMDSYSAIGKQSEVYSSFLTKISNGSEQVMKLFRAFVGFLFANHVYNPKKIVVLYGHKNTIRTIIKLLEYCIDKENLSHIPIEKLSDKNAIKEIENKSVNVSPYIDGGRIINELGFVVSKFSDEYIYAGNKASECTILNDKCFIFSTETSLDIKLLVESVASLENILLIPIAKAVERVRDIDSKVNELISVSDCIFIDSIEARRETEYNDWNFEQLPEVTEAASAIEENNGKTIDDEMRAFIDYLQERCDLDAGLKVAKSKLKDDAKEYCEKIGRKEFRSEIFDQGVREAVCKGLDISTTEFDKEYGTYGKPMKIDGKLGRGFCGIGLKKGAP